MNKIDLIKKMASKNPEDGEIWYLLGLEYSEANMHNEALNSFYEAIKYSDNEAKDKIMQELIKLTTKNNTVGNSEIDIETEIEYTSEVYENDLVEVSNNVDYELDKDKPDSPVMLKVIKGGKDSNYVESVEKVEVKFQDVGGLSELKNTITMKIIKPFSNQGLFTKFKKKIGGGILLYGPPGCGKTFIAKATAGECNATFIPVKISDILDPYLGVSAQNISHIFEKARMKKPSVLFFDEIDTIGFNRSKLSSETMRPIVDQLLSEIEGIESDTDKILIIAATNMPWDVDSALKRPGRFDKVIFVEPPDEEARETIFKLKLIDKPCSQIDYKALAKKTILYSGADIENVVEIATEMVITEILTTGIEREINMDDLLLSIRETKPSTIDWLRTVKNYVKYSNQSGYYDDVEKFLNKYRKLISI